MSDSNELRVKWFGCHLIWDSNDVGCQLIWDSIDLVVNWFEIQMIWLSIDVCFKWFWLSVDLNFKWCGCQLIWDSSDSVAHWSEIQVIWLSIDFELVVNWFEIQLIWMSNDLRFKWFGCQLMCDSNGFVKRSFSARLPPKRRFEAQKRNFCARLPSKLKLWNSKTKHFCDTSFKKRSFEDQKWSFSARLPSKLKLWSSKTKLLYEISFKIEALKLKNEFLQKLRFEAPKRSFCARLPSKMKLWRSKTKHFCETSLKIGMSTGHLTSEFQYVLTIFKWMLQKYCACHQKVEPRHTNSCNCHATWSLQSNISVTWNLQPFHGFCVGGFKHRHRKARNPCACHSKRIVSEPLQIHHACQRFCNPHEIVRLPRILQRVEIPAPATQNALSTSKNVPRLSILNDFDFQIVLARSHGANFAKLNFQKCSEHATF